MKPYLFKVQRLMMERGLSYSEACNELARQSIAKGRSNRAHEHNLWRRIESISPVVQSLPRVTPSNSFPDQEERRAC